MSSRATTAAKFEDLLERLERVEDELLESIETEPGLFRVPGVLDLTGQLKNALRSLRSARDAVRAESGRQSVQSGDCMGREP